jgi:putative PIN family toxin of toxin-antitoxin system
MNDAKPAWLRVVLDTNIYISAFTSPGGPIEELWRSACERHYTLIVSRPIVNEVAETLRECFGWADDRVLDFMKRLIRVAEIADATEAVSAVKDDPDDDRILECAVAGRADLIVSGDRHLRKLKSFRGIAIVHPAEFRRVLGL